MRAQTSDQAIESRALELALESGRHEPNAQDRATARHELSHTGEHAPEDISADEKAITEQGLSPGTFGTRSQNPYADESDTSVGEHLALDGIDEADRDTRRLSIREQSQDDDETV